MDTSQFKQKKLNVAIGAAILSMGALPMLAQAGQFSVDGNPTQTQASLTISNQTAVNNVTLLGSMVSVTNNGTISDSATAVNYEQNVNGSFDNNGYISASSSSAFGVDVSGDVLSTGSITVSNGGTISVDGVYEAVGIQVDGTVESGGTITVQDGGSIDASASSSFGVFAAGIVVDDEVSGAITNHGEITAVAMSGAFVAAVGILGEDVSGSIENTGDIDAYAQNAEIVLAGGIAVENLTGDITNSGYIGVVGEDGSFVGASGIVVFDEMGEDSSITNTVDGEIVVSAGSAEDFALAVGIAAFGIDSVYGTITNDGYINASAYYGEELNATGIYVDNLYGSVVNSGEDIATAMGGEDIEAIGIAADTVRAGASIENATGGLITAYAWSASSAYAAGIDVGTLDGSVTNNGGIIAEAYAYENESDAAGIFVGYMGEGGSITNNDDIYAAAGSAGSVYATGIDVETSYGSITNNGGIDVSAQNAGEDSAAGIAVDNLYGASTVTNGVDGNITAEAYSAYFAYATGIYAGYVGEDASITNEGEINVDAYSAAMAGASGISVGSLYGSITNEGEIDADAYSAGSANATGIYAGTVGEDASITNEGDIYADAYGDMAEASGIYVDTLEGTITNGSNGFISAGATSSSYGGANAAGIYADSVSAYGSITNEGEIEAYAYGSSSSSFAAGIDVGTLNGTITNSGDIYAGVGYSGFAAGINIDTNYGVVNNTGSISAGGGSYDEYALYFDYGNGTFNNNVGGLVEGNIYLGEDNNFNNAGGTLAFTDYQSGFVGGDYDQTDGGVLQIGVYDDNDYGFLNADGTISLESNANIYLDVDIDNDLADGEELWGVYRDTDGEDGAMAIDSDGTFTITDNTFEFNFFGEIDGEDGERVDLNVVDMGSALEQVQEEGSPAAEGAAEVFDEMSMDPDGNSDEMNDAIRVLASLKTKKELADAIESTIPSISGGVAELTRSSSAALTRTVGARQGRRGASSGDSSVKNRGLWLQPFGSEVDQDDRNGVTGYEIDSSGIAIGVDADISDSWNVGLAVAYIESDVKSNLNVGQHDVDVESYQMKAYATKTLSATTAVNLQIGLGTSDYDSKRVLFNSSVANADYDSWNLEVNAEVEQTHQLNANTSFTPYAFADYSYVDVDSYNESGAGVLNLMVNDDDADSLVLGAGVRANHAATDALSLTANASIGYDVLTDKSDLTAAFSGGGASFTTDGIEPDEVVYSAGLGAEYSLTNGTDITLEYNVDGRDDYTDQSITAKLRFLF